MEDVKLVNIGLVVGEEIFCFQNPITLKIYDLEDIDRIFVNGEFRDFQNEDISYVLNKDGHSARIDETNSGNIVLYV